MTSDLFPALQGGVQRVDAVLADVDRHGVHEHVPVQQGVGGPSVGVGEARGGRLALEQDGPEEGQQNGRASCRERV